MLLEGLPARVPLLCVRKKAPETNWREGMGNSLMLVTMQILQRGAFPHPAKSGQGKMTGLQKVATFLP